MKQIQAIPDMTFWNTWPTEFLSVNKLLFHIIKFGMVCYTWILYSLIAV